jgi:hypothetical protein
LIGRRGVGGFKENMFSQPIVFVVGAGASAEYGMPTGAEMKHKIAQALNFTHVARGLTGDREFYEILIRKFGRDSEMPAAATELATRIAEFDSIDEALHWLSARPGIVSLGKATIVREILQYERSSKLFNESNPALIRHGRYNEDWLPPFLTMVVGSLRKDQAKDAFQNITIINFNYDRTVEHFLYSRLQINLGLNDNETIDLISSLRMIRPYGSVGRLPWEKVLVEGGVAVPFGAELKTDHEELFALSENVRTYTEQNLSVTHRSEITSAIDKSRLIVFLGFGFHQQNMAILQTRSPAVPWRRVLGTVLGIDAENYESQKVWIGNTVGCSQPTQVQLLARNAYHLLYSMKPTLMANL